MPRRMGSTRKSRGHNTAVSLSGSHRNIVRLYARREKGLVVPWLLRTSYRQGIGQGRSTAARRDRTLHGVDDV